MGIAPLWRFTIMGCVFCSHFRLMNGWDKAEGLGIPLLSVMRYEVGTKGHRLKPMVFRPWM